MFPVFIITILFWDIMITSIYFYNKFYSMTIKSIINKELECWRLNGFLKFVFFLRFQRNISASV